MGLLISEVDRDKVDAKLGATMSLAGAMVERRMRIASGIVEQCMGRPDPDTVQFVYNELESAERDVVETQD